LFEHRHVQVQFIAKSRKHSPQLIPRKLAANPEFLIVIELSCNKHSERDLIIVNCGSGWHGF